MTVHQPRNLRIFSLVRFIIYFVSFSLDTVEKFMSTQEKLITYYCRRGVETIGQCVGGNQIEFPRSFEHRSLSVAPDHIEMITSTNQGSVDIGQSGQTGSFDEKLTGFGIDTGKNGLVGLGKV